METTLRSIVGYTFCLFLFFIGCGQKTDTDTNRKEQEHTTQESKSDLKIPTPEEPKPQVEGNSIQVDESGNLISHTVVEEGRPVYRATYKDQQKISNQLLPWIQDSFLFEDKYYLKVYFPFPYRGKITIELENDPEYVLTTVEDQTYQLVINHALDLNRVDFNFHYSPAAADTLVESTFSYRYVIMDN